MSYKKTFLILLFFTVFFSMLTLSIGPGLVVSFPLEGETLELFKTFFWNLRFPRLLVAFFSGGSLALVALLLQTYFQNPLAGPFVLGIHSGASLGVALWIFFFEFLSSSGSFFMNWGQVPFAFIGSLGIMLILITLLHKTFSKVLLLVVGLVFSYFVSGIINILISLSDSVQIKNYVLWNLGSFDRLSGTPLIIFIVLVIMISGLSFLIASALNALTIGEDYALTLGVSLKKVRVILLGVSAFLTALVVSFCGPIAFIGIISPHILRRILNGTDHRYLIPLVFLVGGNLALMANFFSSSLPWFQLPLNAVLGLFGAPILFIILNSKKMRGLN